MVWKEMSPVVKRFTISWGNLCGHVTLFKWQDGIHQQGMFVV